MIEIPQPLHHSSSSSPPHQTVFVSEQIFDCKSLSKATRCRIISLALGANMKALMSWKSSTMPFTPPGLCELSTYQLEEEKEEEEGQTHDSLERFKAFQADGEITPCESGSFCASANVRSRLLILEWGRLTCLCIFSATLKTASARCMPTFPRSRSPQDTSSPPAFEVHLALHLPKSDIATGDDLESTRTLVHVLSGCFQT